MLTKLAQPENDVAPMEILVTVLGIVRFINAVRVENAVPPIPVTRIPENWLGIVNVVAEPLYAVIVAAPLETV
jgi:hypothetical protein